MNINQIMKGDDIKGKQINNKISIQLNNENKNNNKIKKTMLNVFLKSVYKNELLEIKVNTLSIKDENIDELKFNLGEVILKVFSKFDKDFKSKYYLSYYLNYDDNKEDVWSEMFNYLGEINIEKNPFNDLNLKIPKNKNLYLKLRQKIKISRPEIIEKNHDELSNNLFNTIKLNEEIKEEDEDSKNNSRGNERTILEALITVAQFEKIRLISDYSISENYAAKNIVKVPKKTLDKYKKAIEEGRMYQFNFVKNYECKMNVLYKYIEERKKLDENLE